MYRERERERERDLGDYRKNNYDNMNLVTNDEEGAKKKYFS